MAVTDTISAFWGKFRQPLAALDRCTLNRGAFAFKIVRGDPEVAAQGRVTLNTGDRNSRFDCISINDTTFKLSVFWPSDTESRINKQLRFSDSVSLSVKTRLTSVICFCDDVM